MHWLYMITRGLRARLPVVIAAARAAVRGRLVELLPNKGATQAPEIEQHKDS